MSEDEENRRKEIQKKMEELRQKRRKWVDANRENGFEAGIKRLLTNLYPDNAHFIYELLQNAEDPHATTVRFTLSDSAVEFEHDGERVFSFKDVESITSIGVSTKRDDPTSIGQFGVGFKAVFAYTNTPEIHSGEFHFRIHDLVVPETNGVQRPQIGDQETRFLFPFDNQKKPRKQAVQEVERGLRALGDNTLLFLSRIRTIEYLLPDGSLGALERVDHEGGHIEIRARHPGGSDTVSQWLRFQKDVEVVDEDGMSKNCRIAIAYQLESDSASKKKDLGWKIAPLDNGQVSIYFPASEEKPNLRFHLHAPFASTVARDVVRKEVGANNALLGHLAQLAVESLNAIRDRGLLTVDFLATLPNPQDNLPGFYEPIRKAIVTAFKERDLTPTRSGSHVSADGLFRGPARIQEVIEDGDISLLTQYEVPLWAKNPPQENQREARFLDSLGIEDWGWSELVSKLDDCSCDDERARVEEWIQAKDDSWLLRFYALLGEAQDEHEEVLSVSNLRIVRVDTGDGDTHVVAGDAYFLPGDDADTAPDGIPLVKPSTYLSGKSEPKKRFAKSFLEAAGVRPFDEKAVIERILAQYEADQSVLVRTHIKHIRELIRFWKQSQADVDLFREVPFLADSANDGTIEETYPPSKLCLDSPFEETGLADLYDIHDKSSVWSGYKSELGIKLMKDFVDFLKAVGVMHALEVERVGTQKNPNVDLLRQDYFRYGVKWTGTAIDEDYMIANLPKYLRRNSMTGSRLIWNTLIHADLKYAKARFRPNQQYPIREEESQLIGYLKQSAWIPTKSGEFRKPQDMSKDDLRTDFPSDERNGLLTAIGFGEHAKVISAAYQTRNQEAQRMGFASADEAEEYAKLKKEGVSLADIRALLARRTQIEQPTQAVRDTVRRRENVLANTADAPSKESVQCESSIQKGVSEVTAQAKAYLRAMPGVNYLGRSASIILAGGSKA